MSLKALAEQRLAQLRADETRPETTVKQVKQAPGSCFIRDPVVSTPVKRATPQKTEENNLCCTVSLPRARNNETSLPAEVATGLARLRTMSCPARINWDVWREVVTDVNQLAADGWASQALCLGWSPLDLFGTVTEPQGDPDADGLAMKLRGRRVLALCESFATVADDSDGRTYIYRGSNDGARLLWEFGLDTAGDRMRRR